MDTAIQVRQILSTRGLTLYNVSLRSVEIFGRSSRFYVPHNLYYDLEHTSSIPTIYQILALSHITDYRLSDWLAVFGFDLDVITRLQLLIPRQQTTILDSTVYDSRAWIPWFAERPQKGPTSSTVPVGHFLTSAPPERAAELLALNKRRFLYATVGDRDLYAVPYFVPGSIVRVDSQHSDAGPLGFAANDKGSFFLVEHDFGWTCSRLTRLEEDRVLLHCPQRPCAARELRVGKDAKILGIIDAELRPVTAHIHPRRVHANLATSGKPRLKWLPGEQTKLPDLLRRSRARVGLSFRDASSLSRWIADMLADEMYFAAASTLSDCEAVALAPRQVQKIVTLCLLYCIGFEQFLRAAGLPLGRAGREPIPDEFVPRPLPSRNHILRISSREAAPKPDAFLSALLNLWEEIPLFLRFSLDEIIGLKGLSLSDVFWVGTHKGPQHPLLVNSTLVAVNRRARKPFPDTRNGICEQPLYLILKRDGSYLCGRCSLDEGYLVVRGYPGTAATTQQFRNGVDAEVVGQVTAILRRML